MAHTTYRSAQARRKRRIDTLKIWGFLFFIFALGFLFGFILNPASFAMTGSPDETEVTIISESCPIITDEPKPTEMIEIVSDVEPTTQAVVTEAPVVDDVKFYYDVPLSEELQDYIFDLCEKEEVPSSLIIAMIDQESDFRPNVISASNDYGLMQINKCNHEWLKETYNITDILDPQQNILAGVKILGEYYHKYDNPHKVLMAYNMGENGMKKAWNSGTYSTSYSREVVAQWEDYQKIYDEGVKND